MAERSAILNVVGLTPRLIGPHTPRIAAAAAISAAFLLAAGSWASAREAARALTPISRINAATSV